MLPTLIKKNSKKRKIFRKRTGIFIKILLPFLFLGLPIIILTYSDFLAKILFLYLPEGTIQKLPLITGDIEFQTRLILILSLVLALFLGILISRHLSQTLEKISTGLKKILDGNLNFWIKIEGRDEIGEVAFCLNQLVENLRVSRLKLAAREKELQEKSLELTEKIKGLEIFSREEEKARLATLNILEDVEDARTILHERLKELEKFNKLAVGRELRMVELKEEIKKLKDELEK